MRVREYRIIVLGENASSGVIRKILNNNDIALEDVELLSDYDDGEDDEE